MSFHNFCFFFMFDLLKLISRVQNGKEGEGDEPNPDLKQLRFTFGGNLRKPLEVFFPLLDPLRLPCQFEVLFIVSSSSSSFYLSFFIDRKSEFNVNRIVVCVTLAETRALQKNIYFGAKLICELHIWIFTFDMIKIYRKVRPFHNYKVFGAKQTLFMKSRETATWTIMFAAKRNHCTL